MHWQKEEKEDMSMKITSNEPETIDMTDIASEIDDLVDEDDADGEEVLPYIDEEDEEEALALAPVIEFAGVINGDEVKEEDTIEPQEEEEEDEEEQPVDYLSVLDHIDDVFDRALTPFMLLGDSALGLVEQGDPFANSDKLHIGLRRSSFYDYNERTLRDWLVGAKYNKNRIDYKFGGVNIRIDLLDDALFFDNPDVRLYAHLNLLVPNPFKEYYESLAK